MAFIDVIKEKAKADLKTIVLPEGMDRRTWEAAVEAKKQGLANIIVLADPDEQAKAAEGLDLCGIEIINPKDSPKTQAYADLL
ncbi:MAG: phosphate acetyltransferase, partial [Lachnospiraceae bacterium]|nr:phosphate acetyltransferase [Lachnospiraceae bacterium]